MERGNLCSALQRVKAEIPLNLRECAWQNKCGMRKRYEKENLKSNTDIFLLLLVNSVRKKVGKSRREKKERGRMKRQRRA